MGKKILLILIIACTFVSAFGFKADSAVQAGNLYYVNNDYQKAADIYQLVIDSGYVAPELYFNLGNAYYKMNNYALAILNYERALLLAPSDKDIKFNLQLANAHVVDKIDVIPEFFLKRWIRSVVGFTSSNTWAVVSMSAFVIFIVLLLIYLFTTKIFLKQFSFYLLILFFVVSAACFVFSKSRLQMIMMRNGAVIVAPSVTAKSSPDEYGTNLFILHEGTKVEVVDSIGKWNEIKISNGNKGWVKSSAFKLI